MITASASPSSNASMTYLSDNFIEELGWSASFTDTAGILCIKLSGDSSVGTFITSASSCKISSSGWFSIFSNIYLIRHETQLRRRSIIISSFSLEYLSSSACDIKRTNLSRSYLALGLRLIRSNKSDVKFWMQSFSKSKYLKSFVRVCTSLRWYNKIA